MSSRAERKKQLYKLIVAQSDILAAATACNLFIDTVDHLGHPLYYPLFCSMVVCYGRPFSDNKPFGPLPKTWRYFSDKRLQALHDDLLNARNKIIAHSDLKERQVAIFPPGVKFGSSLNESGEIAFGISSYYFPIKNFTYFRALFADLGPRLMAEIEKELSSLYSGLSLPQERILLDFEEGL